MTATKKSKGGTHPDSLDHCLAPLMMKKGVIKELGYKEIAAWSLWVGTASMVTSGLLHFALQSRTIGGPFSGITAAFRPRKNIAREEIPPALSRIEVSRTCFIWGVCAFL